MFIGKEMAVPTNQKIVQEKVTLQKGTYCGVVTNVSQRLRSERSGCRYYRRPYRYTASNSLCECCRTSFTGKDINVRSPLEIFLKPGFVVLERNVVCCIR